MWRGVLHLQRCIFSLACVALACLVELNVAIQILACFTMEFVTRSRRSPVQSSGGIVATSQVLATAAGLKILAAGGNAADAAVASAAALNVTEPNSTGIGGDMFALYWDAKERRVFAINGFVFCVHSLRCAAQAVRQVA
jgi:hypothetical protein